MSTKLSAVRGNGQVVGEGDILEDHRGERWMFVMVTRDRKIYCKKLHSSDHRIFFPSVFELFVMEGSQEVDNRSKASGE